MKARSSAHWRSRDGCEVTRRYCSSRKSLRPTAPVASSPSGAEVAAGVTRRTTVREEGSLRVRFPGPVAPALQAVIVNTAGGTAGGDRYDIACHAGVGADLTVSTAAAEKVYRSIGTDAEVSIRIERRSGRRLGLAAAGDDFLRRCTAFPPDRCDAGRGRFCSDGGGHRFRPLGHGRSGAHWQFDRPLARATRGKLVFAETVRLDGKIAARLAEPAVAGGNIALATVLIAPGERRAGRGDPRQGQPIPRRGRSVGLEWLCAGAALRARWRCAAA